MGHQVPLCVEHARNLECEGEGCKTCRMVCNDIENGQLHAYDDTASWGSEWSDGRVPLMTLRKPLFQSHQLNICEP